MNQPYELDFIKTNLKRKIITNNSPGKKQEVNRKREREREKSLYGDVVHIYSARLCIMRAIATNN